ncbi:hypothetical protein L6164_016792 [Bauhinia variegata]|uniref:Uncharacterized protein n=1 Tax=Bauhinia variegata TaxID=167791 RepID=A0ACB9N5V1_BAUVA|nr:hypothetical protein L6164_016792 [Bauhinia variegata]
MAHLLASNPNSSLKLICSEISNGVRTSSTGCCDIRGKRHRFGRAKSRFLLQCCSRSSSVTSLWEDEQAEVKINEIGKKEQKRGLEYLMCDYGWAVRRLAEKKDEIREAAQLQAEAFHVPVALFNDLFFQFFQAEVLSGLLYKLNNSPPDRYACLVAEPAINGLDSPKPLVGIVDVTSLRDKSVLQHLPNPEAEEYLYISGIAVSKSFRRKKVATALLKACDLLAIIWGFEFLALRAYEEDWGARILYANAGYKVVSRDPPWLSTWIGRKPRVLMIKKTNLPRKLNLESQLQGNLKQQSDRSNNDF